MLGALMEAPVEQPEEYRVTVFCASAPAEGRKEKLFGLAATFGSQLAKGEFVCVNGGSCGMMHHVSRGAYQAGGKVYCVGHARWRFDHAYYTESELYPDLHLRQRRLIRLGMGFVALPGGVGTDFEVYDVLCSILAEEIPLGTPLICVGRADFESLRLRIIGHIEEGRAAGYKLDPLKVITIVDDPEEAIDILKAHRERLVRA